LQGPDSVDTIGAELMHFAAAITTPSKGASNASSTQGNLPYASTRRFSEKPQTRHRVVGYDFWSAVFDSGEWEAVFKRHPGVGRKSYQNPVDTNKKRGQEVPQIGAGFDTRSRPKNEQSHKTRVLHDESRDHHLLRERETGSGG